MVLFPALFYTYFLFNVQLFVRRVGSVPTWTQTPSSLNNVSEGVNFTLNWSYNLDGSFRQATLVKVDDGGKVVNVADKLLTLDPTVFPDFEDRFHVQISDTQTSVTIVSIPRSDHGKYQLTVVNNILQEIISEVEISVLYEPNITYISGNKTVNESDTVTLTCTADGYPIPITTWTRVSDDSPVAFPLIIAGKQDEGGYRCTANNGVGSPDSRIVFIFVENYHPIKTKVTLDLSDNSVTVNTTFNITCSAQANPAAKYRFFKDQKTFKNDTIGSDVAVIKTSISERVKQVNYSCTPFNDFGDGPTEAITLTVLFSPKINYAPPDYEVIEGSGAILFCNATGNTQPNITWTKQGNNSELSTSETLNLTNLTREDDGSVYTCTATNEVGSVHATTTVTVFFPPTSTIHNCPSQVTEGVNVTLYCNATGNPPPKVAWTSSGEVLVNDSAYILPAINRSQAGTYECVAWNGIGNNFTTNCTVDVQYPPASTMITTLPSNTTVLRDAAVSLICTTVANPAAHIYHFYFNGNLIGNSSSGVLNVTVKADGVYTCIPINTVGTGDNDTVSITAVVASSVEISPTASAIVVEGNSVTLTCNASGKPEPVLTWTKVGSNEVLSNTSSLTIVNVSRPGTPDNMIQYHCTVSNGVGTPATATATINIYYPPGATTLTTVPSNRTLLRGSIVSLNCGTVASPEAEYYFFFNGNLIGNSSSGVLNITVKADGVYTCVPINTVGTGDNATVSITAVVAPSVEISPTTAIVIEGNNLALTCNASGNPIPNPSWTKLGSLDVLSNTSSLTIVNVSRPGTPDNMIQYQCTASNGVGKPATATATINVYFPPFVTIEPTTEDVDVGKSAYFECHASGNPPPNIKWISGGRGKVTENGRGKVLHFEEVALSDERKYNCAANNSVGTSNASAELYVIDRENEDSEINATIKITNVLFGIDLNIKSSKADCSIHHIVFNSENSEFWFVKPFKVTVFLTVLSTTPEGTSMKMEVWLPFSPLFSIKLLV